MIIIKTNNRESTLERAIKILEHLAFSKESKRMSDIADFFDIPYGTTYKILKTLEKHNLIERENTSKQYGLGFKMFQLGNHVEWIKKLRDISLPYMRELTRECGETSQLGIIFENDLYILKIIETPNSTKTRANVGITVPIHAPAAGKCLFAYQATEKKEELLKTLEFPKFTPNTITDPKEMTEELEKIVEQGYAVDNEEVFLGTTCIAAPIYNSEKKVCAALGITGDSKTVKQNMTYNINTIQHEAMNISFKLGYQL